MSKDGLPTLVAQCAWLCGFEPRCAGFVDNREASPPYCVFKAAATNTRDEPTKDVWEKTLACSLPHPLAPYDSDPLLDAVSGLAFAPTRVSLVGRSWAKTKLSATPS